MMKHAGILIAMVMILGASTAQACGACVEDRVAATYDHTIIQAAIARHQQVVFVALDGTIDVKKVNTRIAAAAPKVRGVVAGTLRTSAAPPAFSFGLDANQSPELAVASFRKILADSGARLTMVRIMRDGALIEP
jgi:hypothetical protein